MTDKQIALAQSPAAIGLALMPKDMDQAARLASAMASAKLVPRHLQGDPGSCLMVIEQAIRWNMSPFAVAQCTSVIGGKLMYEGKLVAAAVESSGFIDGGFDYKFSGEGDNRTVTVSALRRGESTPRPIQIRLGDVKTDNPFWKKQPDQQLVYSGSRNWARRWAPSVILGVYSPEEFDRARSGVILEGETIEAEPAPEPQRAAAAATPRPERVYAPDEPAENGAPRLTVSGLLQLFSDVPAGNRAAYLTVVDRDDVRKAIEVLQDKRPAQHAVIEEAMRKAWARTEPPRPDNAPEMADAGAGEPEDEVPF